MTRRYRVSREAQTDLRTIWRYIARDNVSAADRVLTRLDKAFQLLAAFPNKGHRRADVSTTEPVLFWPEGSCVIVYRPQPKPILIVRVLHGARDLDALL